MESNIELIVNADDFGYNTAVNEAVVRSFQQYLINSTSIMANMPGFGDALQRLHAHPFLSNRAGLHLNITEGYPLSDAIRACPRFCDTEGRFVFNRHQPLFFLHGIEQRAVYAEFRAQMEKVIDAGILPIHLDSHHHVHTEWAILPLTIRLGKEYGVPRIRMARNMGLQGGYTRRIYKRIFSRWLKIQEGINSTDYFGDIDDLAILMRTRPMRSKSIEVMVHPLLNGQGELVDYDQKDLKCKLTKAIDHHHVVTYTDI
jgi:predicted glycoside hydrolase/deacetylase ChbG (UPF0249 family)